MNRRSPLTAFAALCVFVFLYAPLALVIVYSFNAARYGVEWQGFTVDWYLKLIDNDPAIAAAIKEVLGAQGLKMPALAMPVRVLVMGTPQTPSLDAVLALFSRDVVIERLSKA